MTARALLGLGGLNLLVLLAGIVLVWGLCGYRTLGEVVRLAGVAYLVGLAALVVALTTQLVVGIPLRVAATLAFVVVLAAGVAAGIRAGRSLPRGDGRGWRLPELPLIAAPFVGAIGLYLEGAARSARLQGLSEFDAWWCWALQAKAVYFFDGLDPDLFGDGAPRCPGYPPGLAAFQATAFHAMGSTDVITFHLQACVMLAALVAAVAGLLSDRVRPVLLYPVLLFAIVLPSVTDRLTDGRADIPLGVFVVGGTVLLARRLETSGQWLLPGAVLLLGAGTLAKREGVLLAACALGAALVATARTRRDSWPSLLLAGAAVVLVGLPWRLWLLVGGAPAGGPEAGYLAVLREPDRAWPAFELAVRTFLDLDLWLVATPLALAAAVAALLAGDRRVGAFVLAFAALALLACWWAIWTNPSLELTQDYGLNPIVRLVGTPVLVLVALMPLALERGWGGTGVMTVRPPTARGRRIAAWAVVAVLVVGYPLSALTGYDGLRLPGGLPAFPDPGGAAAPSAGRPYAAPS